MVVSNGQVSYANFSSALSQKEHQPKFKTDFYSRVLRHHNLVYIHIKAYRSHIHEHYLSDIEGNDEDVR